MRRRSLFVHSAVCLLLSGTSAWAQSDEDAPIEPSKVRAEDAAKGRNAALSLTSLRFGTGIEGRKLQGEGVQFQAGGQVVAAFAIIKNRGPETAVEMVWLKNEAEIWRVRLDIGRSKGWRTWSRYTLRPGTEGRWRVAVLDASGAQIGAASFQVTPTK